MSTDRSRRRRWSARLVLFLHGLAPIAASAAPPPEPPASAARAPASELETSTRLAAALATLRAEVEALAADIESEREAARARGRSLAGQRASLEAERGRERLRAAELSRSLERQRARLAETRRSELELGPSLSRGLEGLRRVIAAGLPYRRAERLAELDTLEGQLADGLVSPSRAAARLWERIEDELRLGRESGLDRQLVRLDGEEVLADVVHLGLVSMYLRAPDGRLGRFEREAEGWRAVVLEAPEDRARLAALFDAFDKRLRGGLFELPAALPVAPLPVAAMGGGR